MQFSITSSYVSTLDYKKNGNPNAKCFRFKVVWNGSESQKWLISISWWSKRTRIHHNYFSNECITVFHATQFVDDILYSNLWKLMQTNLISTHFDRQIPSQFGFRFVELKLVRTQSTKFAWTLPICQIGISNWHQH